MTTKIKIPTFCPTTDDYDTYRNEIEIWKIIGKVDKKEQAIMLVYELKKDDPSGIREKVLNEVPITDLNSDGGLKVFTDFMDKHFKKDESVATYEAYLNFEKCKKEESEDIGAFVMKFDKQANTARKKKVTYPNLVLAFKLLDNSGLTEMDRKLALSEMDFSSDTIYEDTKKALIKYKSDSVCSRNTSAKSTPAIKCEESVPVMFADGDTMGLEEALVAAGWSRPRSNTAPSRGNRWTGGNRGAGGFQSRRPNYSTSSREGGADSKHKNPKGKDGKHLRCFICDSICHMKTQCPHYRGAGNAGCEQNALLAGPVTLADEAANKMNKAFFTRNMSQDPVEDFILYTGNNKDEL